MGTHRPGMNKALRLVDGRAVGQRNNRRRHQPPANGITPHDVEQHLVQPGELLAHNAADGQQWLYHGGKPGQSFDQLADARLESSLSDDADFQPEVTQGAAQIGINVEHLALHQLARS